MNIFSNDGRIISNILNRIMNNRELIDIYVYKANDRLLKFLYSGIEVKETIDFSYISNGLIFLHIENLDMLRSIVLLIQKDHKGNDYVIYIPEDVISYKVLSEYSGAYPLDNISDLNGTLFLRGVTFDNRENIVVPSFFRILAIMHFYNEADILKKTITYLLNQGLDIYLIDNWSDDGSYEIAEDFCKKYPDRIYLERFPETGKNVYYEWYNQLERTEVISMKMDYDWFIHYDADEMRVSPWKEVSLREAIYRIDQQGYNCIENTVIDFKLTDFGQSDIFMQDTFFDFRHKKKMFDQVKTWKKSGQIELKSSGGHFARIENPRLYPLKFLNRHYPLRSMEQAEKKVFCDRLPRFYKERNERGWHGHYDRYYENKNFLSSSSDLLLWNENTFDELYIPLFLECGLKWDESENTINYDLPEFEKKKLVLYGAGIRGRKIYLKEAGVNDIVGWVDADYKRIPEIYCKKILSPLEIKNMAFDYIIITVKARKAQQEILVQLEQLKIEKKKIIILNDDH